MWPSSVQQILAKFKISMFCKIKKKKKLGIDRHTHIIH